MELIMNEDECRFKSWNKNESCLNGCGYTLKRDFTEDVKIHGPLHNLCKKLVHSDVPNMPFSEKAKRYATAMVDWVKAGRPKRNDEEVTRIYNTICKVCLFFKNDGCIQCGCRINQSKHVLINKLKMKTEHCPKDKW